MTRTQSDLPLDTDHDHALVYERSVGLRTRFVMDMDPRDLAADARWALVEDECSMSRFLCADNFSELKFLRSTVEELIAREESSEIDKLSKEAAKLPNGGGGDFWAENHPYWWEHIIAPQFRGAFFMALLSAAELHLGHLARDAATIVNAPISADDLKGSFYVRVRRFLNAFCGIDKPSEERWQRLLGYYEVRNVLVHRGGVVPDGKKRIIESLARQVPGLVIGPATLEIGSTFCEVAHGDLEAFLLDAWGEVVLLCRSVSDRPSPPAANGR